MSRFWHHAWRTFYWIVTRLGPVIRPWVERFGLGNVVELVVPGRRSGRERTVLLGLLRVDGGWYLGHPNGAANWTRNLDAAGGAMLVLPSQPPPRAIAVELLPVGEERTRVIASTWHQHVLPGPILYWLARRHVMAVGRYYRVELVPYAARNAATPGIGVALDVRRGERLVDATQHRPVGRDRKAETDASRKGAHNMGQVVVFNSITLDGVMQSPARPDDDRRDGFEHGGWAVRSEPAGR